MVSSPLTDLKFPTGFATADLDEDAWAVRYFVERGLELLCVQSFSKNFGLYGERIGNLIMVAKSNKNFPGIRSHLLTIIRAIYLTPPSHGARIVTKVLSSPDLRAEWEANVKTMANRIIEMRKALRSELEKLNTPGDWSHLTTQTGMFSYSCLTGNYIWLFDFGPDHSMVQDRS